MVSNGLVNTVGVNLTHRPINRFTFSGRRITFFAPARLVDSCSSQAVEFSTAITRCSQVRIQIVTVGASKMGDIFSLSATDTLRAFFFHCIIRIIHIYIYAWIILDNYIYIYIYIHDSHRVPVGARDSQAKYFSGSLIACVKKWISCLFRWHYIYIYIYIYIYVLSWVLNNFSLNNI